MTVRQKLSARLTELAEHLPDDLRLVTLAAFAISARQPLYQDRVSWAAMQVDRDSRTVRRRVDEAIDQLAELAAAVPVAAGGWRTAELCVAAALDRDRPEVLERRRIVADQDDLRELELDSPVAGEADVFYGGTLTGAGLVLPRPLSRGESHDVAVRVRLSSLPPYLVCVPGRPCDRFDLRLRFGRGSAPRVWKLHGAFQPAPQWQGDPQPVDRAGEVHLRFRSLTPGLAYGARWE
ncbi:hypothetical protein EWH70_13110 [Amycolatopsis suaedae]|uniref:Uncharacterized protein n=1 Tax=Amycolatopsis suaedae TaxID=2510978 RepID=A0A4V2EM29_9PSEU|nr:hypothetical protein EWH70_13110 [Amycolatopsis suaedae]